MADIAALLDDLRAEGDDLERLVAPLADDAWSTATPAEGWTIAHQIAHLAWTDDAALLAVADPEEFTGPHLREALAAYEQGRDPVDEGAAVGVTTPPADLLDRWGRGRAALQETLREHAASGAKIPWYGPPMSVASMVTARQMETWAHGQDVADALGVTREPTARLRHVAHIGVRTRNFAYAAHQEQPPEQEFRVELTAPDGEQWTWGPDDAAQRVTGPALDFALLVTQRRHVDDLALAADGEDPQHWLTIAQAFAGPPGAGREAGQFA
ncbi:TIGR03084 family metal-binding protein [Luteipulveratus halotolerans]|uniref:Wyosine base formation domain-containing protein n=1 Tax=Luteipulveratus halotolerans TaxID=1631356 RepID=A0A0L6CKZ2_9MICO|nr:TIGR03084 family metal-binding protein [Luteipulveratus halotolerans]KNX38432.1 wyosine base formation domain-containing protein [Luteipulveratus halotolerans]